MSTSFRKIDLTTLRLFVTVCKERNIARAAEREFIAHSAISRRIAELEALLGHPVIERGSRGISMTPVGETVFRYATTILSNIDQMESEIKLFSEGAIGKVRLVGNLSAIVQFLPEDLAAFQRAFPKVEIDLEEQTSARATESVENRLADLCICNAVENHPDLRSVPYRTDKLSLLIPKGHRFGGESAVSFKDCVGETFVGLNDDSALASLLRSEAARLGRTLNIKMRVSSLDALCRMVHVGLGIAVIPQQVGEMYLPTLDIVLVPLKEAWAVRQLAIYFSAGTPLSPTATSLLNFLRHRS